MMIKIFLNNDVYAHNKWNLLNNCICTFLLRLSLMSHILGTFDSQIN